MFSTYLLNRRFVSSLRGSRAVPSKRIRRSVGVSGYRASSCANSLARSRSGAFVRARTF